MSPDELQQILRLHGMWLRGEDGGARAKLSEADLHGADLCETDLRRADLRWANCSGANLMGADLRKADLRWANCSGANLSGAILSRARLSEANLSEADLSGAIDGSMCRMDFGGWSICVRATETSIGCQCHANEKWLAWWPGDVAHMHADARDWWAVHGEVIKSAIRCVMAKAAVK